MGYSICGLNVIWSKHCTIERVSGKKRKISLGGNLTFLAIMLSIAQLAILKGLLMLA